MKQIVVISGKGGTGKTVFSGAFGSISKKQVLVDCDVDASNLHLLMQPKIKLKTAFKSGITASIDKKLCTSCGECTKICRFDAISDDFIIDEIACEGCGFCYHICPSKAISIEESLCGEWYISDTKYGAMVHAKLGIAAENSGRLVSLIKGEAKKIAEKNNADWIIIDGSPGIGCPVIASIGGTDCAIIVTEPTLSAVHDAKRVVKVAKHFKIPVKMIINKYNLNEIVSNNMEKYCRENDIQLLGKIAFDKSILDAVIQGKTIMESDNENIKKDIIKIWEKIEKTV